MEYLQDVVKLIINLVSKPFRGSALFVILRALFDDTSLSLFMRELVPTDFNVVSLLEEPPKFGGIDQDGDCPPEKVWNRYDQVCFDAYDMFDKTARTS